METVYGQHTRRIHKGSWVSRGLGILLLGLPCLAMASQAASSSPSDIALLIQGGHSAPPNKVIAYHNEKFSFLETWDDIDVRLWRRTDASESWRMFRHWKNLTAGKEFYQKNKLTYLSAELGEMFELYDAHNYELRYRVSAILEPRPAAAAVYFVPEDSGRAVILKLQELDSQGRKFSSLHLATPDKGFAPWQPFPGNLRITTFFRLGDGLFAVQTEDKRWQVVQVDASGEVRAVSLPGLPPVPLHEVRRLQSGVFGVAFYEADPRAKEDPIISWHLFRINRQGKVLPVRIPGLEPDAIKEVRAAAKGFVRLVEHASEETDEALLTRFYWVDEDKHLIPVHQAIPGMPSAMRNLRVLTEGKAVGAAEVDDGNGNGIPGNWTWRMQDSRGTWQSPHDLLPGLEGDIWTMVDWLEGEGLGVQTVPSGNSSLYRWHYYLYEAGRWQTIDQVLPVPRHMQITEIRDRRDGLIELVVATPNEQSPAETASPVRDVVRNVHWMIRAGDGKWSAVQDVVAEYYPTLKKRIVAVDARSNSLMVDVQHNADDPPVRLLFYKNRESRWEKLDNALYAVAGRTAQGARPFPKVRRSEVLADGHSVLLYEQDDANWNGQAGETQLLWPENRPAQNAPSDKATQLRYEPDLGLLVRTAHTTGEKHFFYYLEDAETWTDIRHMISDLPEKIDSAFVFANGRGLGVKELFDSNGNGRFSEWLFYYCDDELWRDIGESLLNSFSTIQTIISAGGRSAISVQGAGADEWRYYYRSGTTWVDLRQQWPTLPDQLSNLEVSADGRVLTVREEWDSNGNGLSFELIVGIWSDGQQDFVPLDTLIDQPAGLISDVRSLWNGRGLAIQFTTEMPLTKTAGDVKVTTGGTWHLYNIESTDRWQAFQLGAGDLSEVCGDATGRLLALRRRDSGSWELWTRKTVGSEFVRWQDGQSSPPGNSLRDIRLNMADGIAALKIRDLWIDGEERWELWRQDGDSLVAIGHAATPTWLGLNHHAVSRTHLRFDNANHYLDGRQVDSVPQPVIWFHEIPALPRSQENVVYAPAILTQALAIHDEISPSAHIKALGYGPGGTVVVYHSGGQLLVAGFSHGPVRIETRSLSTKDADRERINLALLVNRLPDGTERQARLDAPDRWLWSFHNQNGRIYYDDHGYFFSETETASELLTFRVGLKVYSFAQFGSYLFRPDLLENRLGLPESSLFELTQRDAERIDLARDLVPEGG